MGEASTRSPLSHIPVLRGTYASLLQTTPEAKRSISCCNQTVIYPVLSSQTREFLEVVMAKKKARKKSPARKASRKKAPAKRRKAQKVGPAPKGYHSVTP